MKRFRFGRMCSRSAVLPPCTALTDVVPGRIAAILCIPDQLRRFDFLDMSGTRLLPRGLLRGRIVTDRIGANGADFRDAINRVVLRRGAAAPISV